MIYLSTLFTLFLWFFFGRAQNQFINHRDLSSCSSYGSCSSCKSDSSCTFLGNSCTDSSSSTVASDSYTFSSESPYCSNYDPSGYINLQSSNSLSLYQLPGANLADHPTCYWRIQNPSMKPVSITIQRSSLNYEDIYIQYAFNSINYSLANKDVSSCDSSTVTVYLKDITSIFIKIKRLSSSSNYKMTVTQVENGSNDQILWPIMIGIGVMLVVFIIIAIIAIVIIVWCLTKSKAYKEIYTVKDFNSKYVNQTLEKMKSGEFKNFNPKYKQDKCIICLENYNENDQVHITNECNHIFHSSCLKIWYSNISSSNLLCPHCNTRNIPDSEPQVSENISIVESLHIEELPQHFKSSLSSSSEEADASNLV